MDKRIASLTDLCFVFGPSAGYNWEVLLWDASRWRAPNRRLIDELYRVTDLRDAAAREFRDFGERPITPAHDAPQARLWCAALPARIFQDLSNRMIQQGVTMFRFFAHREIVAKRATFDWLTVGTLLFAFEHFDR